MPAAVVAGLIAVGVAGVEVREQATQLIPKSREVEPNNDADRATPIALNTPVHGSIGAPLTDRISDIDMYRVELPKPGALSLELSGVADLNLVVDAYQLEAGEKGKPQLRRLFVLDDGPVGEGERLDAVAVKAGPLYVRVQEQRYFLEPDRPPRESTRLTYDLRAQVMDDAGPLEQEPNDTLGTATPLAPGAFVYGYTGAFVPFTPEWVDQVVATADYFVAQGGEEPNAPAMSVLVVPPPRGAIAVVDVAAIESFKLKAREALKDKNGPKRRKQVPQFPEPILVSGEPKVIPLKPSSRGYVVRIHPADRATDRGQRYGVAFVHGSKEGLTAAAALVQSLKAEGRSTESSTALKKVAEAFPSSPQRPELLAGKPEAAKR
jgi:hypothetical protein